jgi:hypothetical protein
VPVRAGPLLACPLYDIVPEPVREAPVTMLSQSSLLVAVHAHPAWVVTLTDALEPRFDIVRLVGEMV